MKDDGTKFVLLLMSTFGRNILFLPATSWRKWLYHTALS